MRQLGKRPTEAETAIMAVLWDRGPSTVRDVHDAIGADRGVGYTTVLKLMQIMADKGLLGRDSSRRTHVYEVAVPKEQMQGRMVGDLIDRAFAGSTASLVMSALSRKPAAPEELAEIRKLLDELEEGDA